MRSYVDRKVKISVVSLFALLLSGWLALTYAEQAIYLLPKGYIVPIIVILDQPTGVEGLYEGKSRVYEIPPTGILYSRLGANTGIFSDGDVRFYYRQVDGARTEISQMRNWTVGQVKALEGASLQIVTARNAGYGYSINNSGQQFWFKSFVIGPLKDGESLFRQIDQLIDQAKKYAEGTPIP